MIVGRFTESHFYPLALFAGGFVSFVKNFSLIWDDNEIGQYRTIEERGWFGARQRVYAISDLETVHSAWIRDTSRIGLSTKHSETVCYTWLETYQLAKDFKHRGIVEVKLS